MIIKKKLFKIILYLSFLFLFIKNNSIDNPIEIKFDQYHKQISFKENYYYQISNINTAYFKKMYLDVTTYVGEVDACIVNDTRIKTNRYYTNNKIYFSIKFNEDIRNLTFSVNAKTNAFYIVHTFVDNSNNENSLIINKLPIGILYLVTIDLYKSSKIANSIVFENKKNNQEMPLMISFFSLNCKISVNPIYKNIGNNIDFPKIKNSEYFSYDLIEPNNDEKYIENMEYKINIDEDDPSNFADKKCIIYTSSIEVTKEHENNSTDIFIPDNIPQQVMFTKDFRHVSYQYVHVNSGNDLIIKFNLKHRVQYKIQLYCNNEKVEKEETIMSNDILYYESNKFIEKRKENNTVCYIQLDITLENMNNIKEPILEFSIKDVGTNSISYIPKNMFQFDFTQPMNSQYYYTELGVYEEGFILTNFLRGNGKVYAEIIEKLTSDEEGIWRTKYKLLNENSNLKIDSFTKKITFSTIGKNCVNSCYLLINVISDVANNVFGFNFPYSIMIQTKEYDLRDYKAVPIISVPIDEFIAGTVDKNDLGNIFQFYSVTLNSNSEQVIIDFQSDTGGLFINVGGKRPTTEKYDVQILPNGKDIIYTISKSDILKKAHNLTQYKNFTEIKNINLTIGVWINSSYSGDFTRFALAVRLENGTSDDIYRVNSNQKVLCKTRKFSDKKFRCVYMIENEYISTLKYIFIFPNVQNKSTIFNAYGNIINQIDYEINPNGKLKYLIPTESNSSISNQGSGEDYLYINEDLEKNECLLVSVETDMEAIVELLSTFYFFQNNITINPSTPQMFIAMRDSTLNLIFPENYMEMVNIRCIDGSSEIYWEYNPEKKYYLGGKDDRLSLTSEKSDKGHILQFKSKSQIKTDFGFIFYLYSEIRMGEFNFDELDLDCSRYYIYSDNKLPLSYYSSFVESIFDNMDYYDIFFSFDIMENEEKIKKYEDSPFQIESYLIDQYTFWLEKKNGDLKFQDIEPITGNYDPFLKTGFIRITKENITNSGIREEEKNTSYLYLSIKKSENNKENNKENNQGNNLEKEYKRISLEISAIKNTPEVFVSELSYQFGKLEKNEKEKKYRLYINKSFKYINLLFSCRNNDALSIKIEGRNDLIEKKEKYGRLIYSLEIKKEELSYILVISRKNNLESEEFFMFQYQNSLSTYKESFKIKNCKLKVMNTNDKNNIKKINYNISLTPVSKYEKYNISYIIKGIDSSNKKDNSKADFSLNFDKKYVVEYCNPKVDEQNNKLYLNISVPEEVEFNYIQVIAQISKEEKLEYLSYDLYDLKKKDSSKQKKQTIVFIILGTVLFIIILILVIIIIIYHHKHKDLLDKVTKVSFSLDREPSNAHKERESLLSINSETPEN